MSPCRSKQRLYETRAGPPRRAGSGRCTLPTTLSTDSRAPTLEQAKAEFVVRKGATPLYPAQRGFVGGSMGDISVILKGKPEGMEAGLLNSTIHGSGRVMSRTQAAGKSRWVKGRKLSQGGGLVDENAWRETMRERGIILRGAGADEMPPVYRPLRSVLAAHQDTFDIETVLLPRIVVMAGSGEHDPYKD